MTQPLQPGQELGSYRVIKELGSGGMGAVYEAVHTQIERRVAIKVLHGRMAQSQELSERFLNEARAVNIIQHPNLISVYDMGRLPDGAAYLVMEFLPGQTLTSRLAWSGGRLGLATLRFARQIADGLAAAHDRGIIHRDLKPDNVMVIGDPETITGERIKILDFGIAKLADDHLRKDGAMSTDTAQTLGTPFYMSPEQWAGADMVDGTADVYSLGVILYQLLAGRLPFLASNINELCFHHLNSQPEPLHTIDPMLPPDLTRLVHSMLAKQPAERPTMRDVALALEQITAVSSPIPVARQLRQRKLVVLSVVSTILALALAGVIVAMALSGCQPNRADDARANGVQSGQTAPAR